MMECRFVWIFFATFLHFTYYGVPSESFSPPFKRHAFVEIRGEFNRFLPNTSEIYDTGYKEIEADEIGKLDSEKQEMKDENRKLFRKKQVRLDHAKQEKKNEIRKLDNDKQENKINVNKKLDKEKSNYEQDESEDADNEKQGNEENGTGMQNNVEQDDEKLVDQKSRNRKLKQLKDGDKTKKKECNENLNLHSDGLDREKRIVCKKQKGKIWKQGKRDNRTKQNGEKSGFMEESEKQYSGTKHSTMQNTNTVPTIPATQSSIQDDVTTKIRSCMMEAMWEDKIKEKWASFFSDSTGNKNLYKITVTITRPEKITLKEVLFYLRNFQLLYKVGYNAVEFSIPVDGRTIKLKLKNELNGRFSANHIYENPGAMEIEGQDNQKKEVNIFNVVPLAGLDNNILKKALKTTIIQLLESTLNTKGVFEQLNLPITYADVAFREMVEFTAACFLRNTGLMYQDQWLNELQNEFNKKINEIEVVVKNDAYTKVKYELTANMLTTSAEAKANWGTLKNKGIVNEVFEGGQLTKVQFSKTGEIRLKCAFKLLQYFLHFYPELEKGKNVNIEMPIGIPNIVVKNAVFQLARAAFGNNQILVNIRKKHYPDAITTGRPGKYEDFIDKDLSSFENQKNLANALLTALESRLNDQPNFDKLLEVQEKGTRNDAKTAMMYRTTVEFLAITMIAEAAQPSDDVKRCFLGHLSKFIDNGKCFPTEKQEMPNLAEIRNCEGKLEGRTPVVDQKTIQLLQAMLNTGQNIKDVFTFENFPARGTIKGTKNVAKRGKNIAKLPKKVHSKTKNVAKRTKNVAKKVKPKSIGGTDSARKDAHNNGEQNLPAYAIHFLGTPDQICQ